LIVSITGERHCTWRAQQLLLLEVEGSIGLTWGSLNVITILHLLYYKYWLSSLLYMLLQQVGGKFHVTYVMLKQHLMVIRCPYNGPSEQSNGRPPYHLMRVVLGMGSNARNQTTKKLHINNSLLE
jgi:hypothetical protein